MGMTMKIRAIMDHQKKFYDKAMKIKAISDETHPSVKISNNITILTLEVDKTKKDISRIVVEIGT